MKQSTSYTLRFKVLTSMIAFIVLIIASALYQLKTLQLSEQNHQLLGELKQLEELGSIYPRRSKNYVNNAARDFESYQRDVQVFHKDIIGDIDQYGALLKKISNDFSTNIGFALPKVLQSSLSLDDGYKDLQAAISNSNNIWQDFYFGFNEKIGSKKDEPRIEWGAQFIVDESPKVNSSVQTTFKQYRVFLDQQRRYSLRILQSSLILITLLGFLGLFWFYQKIIKRIGNTVEACEQVAKGDYSYVLPVNGNDELSVLAESFNMLASRAQQVVAMLSDLQQVPSVEHALNVIVKASGNHLPVAWAGFIRITDNGNTMSINNALPPKSLNDWLNKSTDKSSDFGQKISSALLNQKAFSLNNLRQYITDTPDELMLHDMIRASQIEALFVLPITAPSGWEGILLFGSRNGAYSKYQTESLENLSPLLATSFERLSYNS